MNIWKKKKISFIIASVIVVAAIAANISGCGKSSKTEKKETNQSETWNIVATTTMLADLTNVIGGERVSVTSLMGPGIDPHLYQASAGDVTSMQEADIIVYNGLHLEGKMGEVFDALEAQERIVICIENGIGEEKLLADEEDSSIHDPHIWFDTEIWKEAARYTAEVLTGADPDYEAVYMSNLKAYLEELDELDQYIRDRIEEIPEQQRVLITAHDAFQYFGHAYGIEVKGLQGISTDAEAGTADVSELAAYIAEQHIKAVFVESSVPSKTIEALQEAVAAKGFQVEIGGELYSDSLGDAGSGHDTYIETCKANVDIITEALK